VREKTTARVRQATAVRVLGIVSQYVPYVLAWGTEAEGVSGMEYRSPLYQKYVRWQEKSNNGYRGHRSIHWYMRLRFVMH